MSEDAIKTEGLTKVFNGSLVAVDHINFSVKNGEIFGFLGPNGATRLRHSQTEQSSQIFNRCCPARVHS